MNVLDASAILAFVQDEDGSDVVEASLVDARVTARLRRGTVR